MIILCVYIVKISWVQQVQTVNESVNSVTICANAEDWTTTDRTLTIPILVQDDTATSVCVCVCVCVCVIFNVCNYQLFHSFRRS